MAKFTPDAGLDQMADDIIATVTRQVLCSAQPTTYTEANSTYALADVTIDSGDMTKADNDGSGGGRKLTIAAQTGVLIDASGTGTHIALLDVAGTALKYVTTCTSQAVTANGTNTVNMPAWAIRLQDPA